VGGTIVIYEFPPQTDPIRQGDIFVGLPRLDMSLKHLPVISEAGEQVEMTWDDIVKGGQPVATVVALRPVIAIVATQDCDALRAPDITLCEIRAFQDVERKSKDTKAPKSWVNIITQHARINQKWFYLPPDQTLGLTSKMAVDFMVTLRVLRTDLEDYKSLRKGRLNSLAEAHFRERIGEFFRRYPYDEWYPLAPDEMKAYLQDYPDVKPFPWQLTSETTQG
jgi:hypothetical protein